MDHVLKLEAGQQPPAGYVLRDVSEDMKGGPRKGQYAVLPRAACAMCNGTGYVVHVVSLESAGSSPEGNGKRLRRWCGCVDGRLLKATVRGSGSFPLASTPEKVLEMAAERQRLRVERMVEELATARAALRGAELARERAMAPHLAHKAEAERQAAEAKVAAAEAATVRLRAADALMVAEDALATAQAALKAARKDDMAPAAAADEADAKLAPLAAAVMAAAGAADKAGNAGHRHRIQVAAKRVDDLEARLERVAAGLPSVDVEAQDVEPLAPVLNDEAHAGA